MTKPTDWSGLADEARQELISSGPRCKVKMILDSIDDEKARKLVQGVIEDTRISATAVNRALVKRLGEDAPTALVIRTHRRQDCACHKAVT